MRDMRYELDRFAENTKEQDIVALFSVKVIRNSRKTLSGDRPETIMEFTSIPHTGFTREQCDEMRELLKSMASIVRSAAPTNRPSGE